jgi:DNA-binding transcriptional ArsR family regulator
LPPAASVSIVNHMVNYQPSPLDAIFGALAHPVRRAMLERLSRDGATAGELAEPFDLTLPAVSRHLGVLESAGLIRRRVDGRIHRFGLAAPALRGAMAWLEEHRRFWEPRLDALARYLEGTSSTGEEQWKPRKSARTSRSGSNAGSRRRRSGSSKRGHGPKR